MTDYDTPAGPDYPPELETAEKARTELADSEVWTFNKNYHDLAQVEQFWPTYKARYDELAAAGKYPYNDEFKGLPGLPDGKPGATAIYLLQTLRSVRDMETKIAEHRAAGWRDFDPAEVDAGPVRYAGVAHYGWYMNGAGFQTWDNARLTRLRPGTSLAVLPGRNRTNGFLLSGKVLVLDRKEN